MCISFNIKKKASPSNKIHCVDLTDSIDSSIEDLSLLKIHVQPQIRRLSLHDTTNRYSLSSSPKTYIERHSFTKAILVTRNSPIYSTNHNSNRSSIDYGNYQTLISKHNSQIHTVQDSIHI